MTTTSNDDLRSLIRDVLADTEVYEHSDDLHAASLAAKKLADAAPLLARELERVRGQHRWRVPPEVPPDDEEVLVWMPQSCWMVARYERPGEWASGGDCLTHDPLAWLPITPPEGK